MSAKSGRTQPQQSGRRAPRLPHEHDESSDSQVLPSDTPDESMQRAAKDVARGLPDTDRGPVFERIAREHFEPPRKTARRRPRHPG